MSVMRMLWTSLLIGISISVYGQTAIEANGQLRLMGPRLVNESGLPVQLQGMSLYWSQWRPKFYDYEVVRKLRDDWCTDVVRAAMAVEDHGYGHGYLAEPGIEKAKVKTVVDAAIDLGMYVIIDWHDHHAHEHEEEAIEFFSEMAEEYGDKPNVIYELYNEPLRVSWSDDVKPYCEAVISAIREHDPDNLIICGTPRWSQDVDIAAGDPIDGTNILYALHYYAGTHKQQVRDKATTAIRSGLPLFVTEFGTVDSDGGGDVDKPSSNEWFDFLDKHDLSYCNWSLSDIDEGSAVLQPGTDPDDDWSENLTEAGEFMKARFTSNCPEYYSSTMDKSAEVSFSVYPNPVYDHVTITNPDGYSWELYNSLGKRMKSGNEEEIDMSDLRQGVYYIKIKGFTKKLIKN